MLSLNATQMATAMKTMISMDAPLMVWSSPGVGKSDMVRQLAEDINGQLVDVRLAMWDTVDMRGIPNVVDGTTHWNPPAVLPFEGNTRFDPSRPIVLFLDEVLQALPAVQSVAFQLVLDRAVGEHKLMPNVRVLLASNRMTDRAGANRMSTALSNRMTHVELIPHVDSFCKWAWAQNKNPLPIAFLRLRPDLLSNFDPAKGDVAFATPRSWAKTCDIVEASLPVDIRYPLVAGTIGEGPATELEAFIRVWTDMPNIEGILMSPKTADVPTKPDILYAVSAALAHRATKGNMAAICEYLDRLPAEFAMVSVKDAVRRTPEIQQTIAFNVFAVKHASVWSD